MQSSGTFWKYALSFGTIVIVSLILLFVTNHFAGRTGTPETTCITSSGDPC
jgi:hypothetical protein